MNTEKEETQTDLSKKKKKTFIIWAAVIVLILACAVPAGIYLYNNYQKYSLERSMEIYDQASAAEEEGNYSEAAKLYGKITNFKDSWDRKENCEFAVEFTSSDVYTTAVETAENLKSSTLNLDISYEAEDRTLFLDFITPEYDPTLSSLYNWLSTSSADLARYNQLNQLIVDTSENFNNTFVQNGYLINVRCRFINKDIVEFDAVNGQEIEEEATE